MIRRTLILCCLCLLGLAACGSSSDYSSDVPTDSPPYVNRIDPASGQAGDAITIFGFGFSAAAPLNIVLIGGAGSSASAYQLLPNPTATEVESITATVPVGAAVGQGAIAVFVEDNVSNADVLFTVNP